MYAALPQNSNHVLTAIKQFKHPTLQPNTSKALFEVRQTRLKANQSAVKTNSSPFYQSDTNQRVLCQEDHAQEQVDSFKNYTVIAHFTACGAKQQDTSLFLSLVNMDVTNTLSSEHIHTA